LADAINLVQINLVQVEPVQIEPVQIELAQSSIVRTCGSNGQQRTLETDAPRPPPQT
jgi:hypothetical protein